MSVALNGVGRTLAYLNRYDSTLLAYVAWDGQGGGGAAGSTQVAVSSVAGSVTVRPSDTNWASSAGFHFDGSGNLNVAGTFSASTTVNVSSLAGTVKVAPSDTAWASSAGFHFDGSGNLLISGGAGGSSQVTVSQVLDSSGGGVVVADSANNALRVNVVAGAAGGSTIVTVSTGSVRVHQSTAADLNVTVAGYSTTVNVSSLAGRVLADQNSTTWAVQMSQYSTTVNVSSLAGTVNVQQASTANWTVQAMQEDGLGNLIESSTRSAGAANSTMRGLAVRSLVGESTTGSGSIAATSTGDVTAISSAAGLACYVYAYAVSVISTVSVTVRLMDGSTRECWRILAYGSGPGGASSGSFTAFTTEMAVSPPAYLFRTAAANPVLVSKTGSSVAGVTYSVAAWRE